MLLLTAGPWASAVLGTLRSTGCAVRKFTSVCSHERSSTMASSRAFLAASPMKKVLVANRGEIACRVMATAKKLGLGTVAVYSEADRFSKHVQMADEAYCIGGAAARESYLRGEVVLQAAKRAGAQAIHPGYGFLSENASFSEACDKAGIVFVGPPAPAIRAMGDKAQAKHLMSAAGVPVVPGYHGEAQEQDTLLQQAQKIGFPLLVKAVSGGGGKGMKLAHSMEELPAAIDSAKREAAASFGDDRLLLERYIVRPRHVEVQVVADGHGGAVYLFDRDCSVQRRHQKIIEEAPAPGLPGHFHAKIGEAAVRAAEAVGYKNAGTVEFIVDVDARNSAGEGFYFMEMNTRLQVEHPVSEAVANVDLVEWQLVVAAGGQLPMTQQQAGDTQVFRGEHVCGAGPWGHSFEARLYAETPRNNFLPGAGTVRRWRPPVGALSFELPRPSSGSQALTEPFVRVDSGVREGDSVGTHYDPMIAKVITWAPDRGQALALLRKALEDTQVAGLPTNLSYLKRLAAHPDFINLDLDTGFIKRHQDSLMAPQVVSVTAAALAGVARHLLQVQSNGPACVSGAWGIPDSKRLWYDMVLRYRDMSVPEAGLDSHDALKHKSHQTTTSAGGAGLEVEVTVQSADVFQVTVHGLAHPQDSTHHKESNRIVVRHVELNPDGRLDAEVAGRRVWVDVVQFDHGREQVLCMWLDGEQYEFRWPLRSWSKDVRSAAGTGAGAGGQVRAPMPGRVVKVLVQEGHQVKPGAPVLLMEAMKMEHAVVAPRAGTVSQLAVAAGMQLTDGQLLMVIEEKSNNAEGQGDDLGNKRV